MIWSGVGVCSPNDFQINFGEQFGQYINCIIMNKYINFSTVQGCR